jgi:GT2 family glycosyltransferase
VLNEYSQRDNRIKVVFRPTNGHISAASNTALEIAEGDFVVLLDHDDELSADALYWVANELNEHQETVVIYSDEDLIDGEGRRSRPKFKPDFSRDLFYSFNLLTHLSAFEMEAVRSVGGFRTGFEGSQDYDLALRIVERIREEQIRHIPRILYHWRAIPGSVAFSMNEKPYAHERARLALNEHFERTGTEADILESVDHLHRVRYQHSSNSLSVSLIVMGQSTTSVPEHGVELIRSERTAEALNDAAGRARGNVLLFLDAGLEWRTKDALDELASFALQAEIGAAGAKILSRRGVVEQCGLVLTPELRRALAHAGFPRGAAGDMSRNRQIGNFSATSVSCMAIRRDVFESVGGFDESVVPSGMFDVDLCLKLRKAGHRIVTLPHVEVVRREGSESVRGGAPGEMETFQRRWPEYIQRDPFCNPNLKRDGSFEIFFAS